LASSGAASLTRRQLLQLGVGSAGALGLPLLVPERVSAADGAPQRLLLVFTPNGTVPDAYWPAAGLSETDFTLNTIMQPLTPFRERLLILKGLRLAVAQTGPGGPHQKGVGGLFTNAELQDGEFVDGDGSTSGWANGPSVDQEVARYIGQQSYLESIELGVRATQNEVRSRISYAAAGAPMPPINSPLVTYQRLFSSFLTADVAAGTRRQSVLDAVKLQYELVSPTLTLRDKQKLELHMDLIRGVERRIGIAPDAAACKRAEPPPDWAPDDEQTMPDIAASQLQLLATAFACDLTRVASLQFSTAINDIRYPWLGSNGSGHTLSHSSGEESQQEIVLREQWVASQLAAFMTQLASIPEGNGSVLDHTLIVWGNELGWGVTHTHENLPFVLAGGASAMRWGRYLEFDRAPHGGLLAALLQAMGVPFSEFGHPEFRTEPLALG
jgi:hypothetical protein